MLDRTQALARLAAHGQAHVLRFFDSLDPSAQRALLDEIEALDLSWLARAATPSIGAAAAGRTISPYDEVVRADDDSGPDARARGEAALGRGKVGVLLVAGGAGSRLGFSGPKGLYPIGAVSGRTLFEVHIDRLRAIGRRYGKLPPLYVMTSPENDAETRQYFADRDHFGLPRDQLRIFAQGVAPAIDAGGKLLLADKHALALAPNGNGGLFAALRDSGALAQMRDLGVEVISYIQVDNVLADPGDTAFIGHHLRRGSEFSCKAIPKRDPFEKVGNYARVDGRLGIIEYYEVPDALVTECDERGELLFNFGNPGLFLWSLGFTTRQALRHDLPIHRAHKRVPYLDDTGARVEPREPNAFKLETFALDTLADAERTLVFACERDAEFAPVKNAAGEDSPATARALMTQLYASWVQAAGGEVAAGCQLEINPRYALDAAELVTKIDPGFVVTKDTYLA